MLAPGDFNLSMMTKLKKKNTLLAIFQMRNTTRFLCIVLLFFFQQYENFMHSNIERNILERYSCYL